MPLAAQAAEDVSSHSFPGSGPFRRREAARRAPKLELQIPPLRNRQCDGEKQLRIGALGAPVHDAGRLGRLAARRRHLAGRGLQRGDGSV